MGLKADPVPDFPHVAVIIPALNEATTIAGVILSIPGNTVTEVIVADNGSTDATALEAETVGARVVHVPRRGYGSACLAALAIVPNAQVVVFLDGDGSDDPSELPRLLEPILSGRSDLVIGARVSDRAEPGSITLAQRLGNALATSLIHWIYGVRFTDLGPFRVITREALDRIQMEDPDYGWTVEMQIKAARLGLRCEEVPVTYRRRAGGQSKVSGTLRGVVGAGIKILWTIARYAVFSRGPKGPGDRVPPK